MASPEEFSMTADHTRHQDMHPAKLLYEGILHLDLCACLCAVHSRAAFGRHTDCRAAPPGLSQVTAAEQRHWLSVLAHSMWPEFLQPCACTGCRQAAAKVAAISESNRHVEL